MSGTIAIERISRPERSYFTITVKNSGSAPLPAGALWGEAYRADGGVGSFSMYTGVELEPGRTTETRAHIEPDLRMIKLSTFTDATASNIPLDITLKRGWLGWTIARGGRAREGSATQARTTQAA